MNALLCRLRNTPIAPTTITITRAGISAVVCSAFPTAKAAVNENTITAVKYENPCHTIAESRNRLSRGVNVVEPNCTTRNRRE